ncbi:hypothetical protein BBK82_26645 [Lentzea guizhouensis]|uniref:Uncharacterized protein n=1 Tax=Lentzea guizhouensis TaxID=1586287 RepID=A0A1B2HN23_9PSEU|nr:hypothetical protein BBK82_26645 [Lentzea guizhouensis]
MAWRMRAAIVAGAVLAMWCLRPAQTRSTGLSCGLYFAPSITCRRGCWASQRRVIALWWVLPLSQMTAITGASG